MSDIYQTLQHYADDSIIEIVAYDRTCLLLSLALDIEAGAMYFITINNPIHLDMPPHVMLGRVEFGNLTLLPENYTDLRNQGYEGDEKSWRVMKITDIDNNFFAIYYESHVETIVPCPALSNE